MDSVTIPKDLFEDFIEDALDLKSEHEWYKYEPRCNYQRDYERLTSRIEQAIKIRDKS